VIYQCCVESVRGLQKAFVDIFFFVGLDLASEYNLSNIARALSKLTFVNHIKVIE
jgi:hypothetical protein